MQRIMDYVILIVQCVMYSFIYISCLCSMYYMYVIKTYMLFLP